MVTPVLAQTTPIPRELAQRLSGLNTNIFVGKSPPEKRLGFTLTVPSKTRVVGATASDETDMSYNFVTVYLTSAQPAADLKAFYQKTFRPATWKRGQGYGQQPGFLPAGAGAPSDALTFCRTRGELNTDIYLTLTPQAQKTFIDVQVSTYNNAQSGSPCDDNGNTYLEPPLPSLTAPKASTSNIAEYLSGFGQGNGSSIIVLDTGLGAKRLLEHYAQQLEAAGWRDQGLEANGTQTVQTAVYRFRYKNEAYVGTLQITPLAKRRYLAQLTVIKPL